MNITILDDYQDTIRTLRCFQKVAGHTVTIWNDHTKDVDALAARLKDTEALALIRERTPIRAPLLDRLDKLRIISQAGVFPHIDVAACTRRGVIVSALTGPGRPSYATAELNWGMIIAAFRRIPQEMAALKAGKWQAFPIGVGLRDKTLGIFGYGKIGAVVAGYGKAFGMDVLVWGRETTLEKARAEQASKQQTDKARADQLAQQAQQAEKGKQPGPPLSANAPAGQPLHVAEKVQAGKLLSQPKLNYPANAKAAHVRGVVRLQALIGTDGKVKNVTMLNGPPELEAAAMENARQRQYQPTLVNGKPVEVETEISVDFQ